MIYQNYWIRILKLHHMQMTQA